MNRSIPIQLEKLIDNIDSKMPKRIVGYEQKPELCLWNVAVIQQWHPIIEKKDHVRKMKLAWLTQGNVGLLNYIEPYINKNRLNRVRAIILSIR